MDILQLAFSVTTIPLLQILGEKLKEIENEAEICKKCKRDCQTIERGRYSYEQALKMYHPELMFAFLAIFDQ